MALITLSRVAIALLGAVVYGIWNIYRYYSKQWHLRKIAGPEAQSFAAGNIKQLYAPDSTSYHAEISKDYGPVLRVNGMFGDSQLYVYDTAALYSMYVKDQDTYQVCRNFVETNLLIVGQGIFATVGQHHRKQRKLLNQVFHIAHMREIMPLFWTITHDLKHKMNGWLDETGGSGELNMLEVLANTALEFIGQGGLGYSFEREAANPETAHRYGKAIHAILPSTGTPNMVLFIRFTPWVVKFLGPSWLRRFFLNILPLPDIKKTRDIIDTMHEASLSILETKKAALEKGDDAVLEQIGRGKDIMSLLMKANLEAEGEDKLPEDEIVAQMTSFLLAGMDTTSGALSRILHQLSLNPKVQDKLREELTESRARDGDLPYNELDTLPYLEAVVRETLRMFPPLNLSARTTTKDVVMPLSRPITLKDGTETKSIFVPENTNVMASLYAVNRDPALWGEDVLEWRPERWLEKLPESLVDAKVPGVYANTFTFVGGSRACIGFKFALLGIKVVLSVLIPSFKYEMPEGEEIIWETHRLMAPTSSRDRERRKGWPSKAQLPLKVTKVETDFD